MFQQFYNTLYAYEDVVTATFIVLFFVLGFIEVLLGVQYLRSRLGKPKAGLPLLFYTVFICAIVMLIGYLSDKFPVDYPNREVPRWYILYISIVITYVSYTVLLFFFFFMGRIARFRRAFIAHRRKRKRFKQDMRITKAKYRK